MVATYNVIYVCFVCNFECIIMIISSLYNISSLAVIPLLKRELPSQWNIITLPCTRSAVLCIIIHCVIMLILQLHNKAVLLFSDWVTSYHVIIT